MALHEPLDKVESRVFGVLVEKALTTPDSYPLSLNALLSGCNQRSNRHPVLSLDEQSVSEALVRLRLHHLVEELRAAGARVVKYAHTGEGTLEVDTPTLAVLTDLLLRGPQTAGELRGHAARMAPLPDLAALQAVLGPLEQRGMVQQLAPAPGSRATRWVQRLAPGLHADEEGAAASAGPSAGRAAGGPAPASDGPGAPADVAAGQGPASSTAGAPLMGEVGAGTSPRPGPSGFGPAGSAPSARDLAALAARVGALEEEVALLRRRLEQLGAPGDEDAADDDGAARRDETAPRTDDTGA